MIRQQFKIGFGLDAHRFSKKEKALYLGGVLIPNEKGLKAHSDGDVVLHSLSDAILGALALPNISDIGDLFNDQDSQYKNISSHFFIQKIATLLKNQHYCIANIDITICAQKPRLSEYKIKIKAKIAKLLAIKPEQVNIKATSTEKMDAVGQKKGIYCYSSVLIYCMNNVCD